MRRIHVQTYGCQMNDYESDRTYRLFHDQFGYEWTDAPDEASLVIFNTCSIREKADQKARSAIGRLRVAKLANPEMVIAVGGCLAQSQGEDIQKRNQHVDIVFGTHQWARLPQLVAKVQSDHRRKMDTEFYGWKNYSFLPYRSSKLSHPACEVVTIQNGCDKFCTFCLVPYTRGREVSRKPEEILEEISSLASQGVKEIMLLGQNVNSYGRDRRGELDFGALLIEVAKISGVDRIRFMTSHPAEFTHELVDVMAEYPKICNHLHLPLQSGSDTILERMNRGYTVQEYRGTVKYLRDRVPNLALTTDLIVGFPSETEKDFQATMDALEEFQFDSSYSFLYSPRPHTKAAKWESEFVSREKGSDRLLRLQSRQQEIHDEASQSYVGNNVEVLVEGRSKMQDDYLAGRTRTNRTVNFPGSSELIGQMAEVTINEALRNSLRGEQVGSRKDEAA